mgnify:CR=1 FL=1|jgi:hypothetical protein
MNPSGFYVDPIMFILMCMYMNFHTFRMKIHIRAGVFFISADAS